MHLSTLRAYCFALESWIINHANEKYSISLYQEKEELGWMAYLKMSKKLKNFIDFLESFSQFFLKIKG